MTHKVLIVEDEPDIRELIHFHLFKNRYEVFEASDGEEALQLNLDHKPDLIILDIMIPKKDGLEVCKLIRQDQNFKETRIIFLSAKGEEEDILKGLELGADDYITKPFSPKILIAKIKTVLARGTKKSSDSIEEQGIKIDLNKRKVYLEDNEINLTVTEFELLKHLISAPGQVFTRSQIVNAIKGQNHAVTDRSVDTQLVSLRKKLQSKGNLIETVWGIGYRFKDDEK
ncbi:MAG: DNA-binding response regulator [Halobacteriovoraceae bacterium]|nr:DNA-binding response regulator [Halobacteriovoraceae bacterium]|tara:strand:- start:29 stop:712 length:684 start_codon:yes stop_codon:yes gene_type:complete